MNEYNINRYKELLEMQLDGANKLASEYSKNKEYDTAAYHSARATAFKQAITVLENFIGDNDEHLSIDDCVSLYRRGHKTIEGGELVELTKREKAYNVLRAANDMQYHSKKELIDYILNKN